MDKQTRDACHDKSEASPGHRLQMHIGDCAMQRKIPLGEDASSLLQPPSIFLSLLVPLSKQPILHWGLREEVPQSDQRTRNCCDLGKG